MKHEASIPTQTPDEGLVTTVIRDPGPDPFPELSFDDIAAMAHAELLEHGELAALQLVFRYL